MLDTKYTKWLRWFIILNKRLLKKKGFLIILLLIPVIAFLITVSGGDESGFIRVAVAAKGNDSLSKSIINDLDRDTKVILVTACDTPKEAIKQLQSSKADIAWVIEDSPAERFDRLADGRNEILVNIYSAEDNSFLRSSGEKLFGALFPHLSYRLYEKYATEELPGGDALSEDTLKKTYSRYFSDEGIVDFKIIDSDKGVDSMNYVTSPLRGIMAIIMLFCALSSTMYFLNDEKNGIFAKLSPAKRATVLSGNNIAALFISGIFVTSALLISGIYTDFLTETVMMLLYILSTAGFCALMGTLLRSNNLLGAVSPIILVISLALCPVFLNIDMFQFIKYILPPYYYLHGIFKEAFILNSVIYILTVYPLTFLLYIFTRKYSKN